MWRSGLLRLVPVRRLSAMAPPCCACRRQGVCGQPALQPRALLPGRRTPQPAWLLLCTCLHACKHASEWETRGQPPTSLSHPATLQFCFLLSSLPAVQDASPGTPIFVFLSPGVDVAGSVEALGRKLGFTQENGKYFSVSLGQGQVRGACQLLLCVGSCSGAAIIELGG